MAEERHIKLHTHASHSPSIDRPVGTAGMPSLRELQSAAGANKLPIEEFDDRSLVYSTAPKD
jgi:hypothetical protein